MHSPRACGRASIECIKRKCALFMHARRSPQRGLCARGKRSSVKVAVQQSSGERLFGRARRIFGSPKTGLCAWRKSFLVRCESWRSQTRTRRRTFHYSRIVEMRARAMRVGFSHFIKCEMREMGAASFHEYRGRGRVCTTGVGALVLK